MNKSGPAALLFACLCMLSGCSRAGGAPNTAHAWEVKRVTFQDPGFQRPDAVAGSLLMPHDWVVKAQGNYSLDCVFSPPRLKITAGRPDGSLGLDVYPGHVEAWSDDLRMVQMYRASYANFAKFRQCMVRETPTLDFLLHLGMQQQSFTADGPVEAIPQVGLKLAANVRAVNAQLAQNPGAGTVSAAAGRLHFHGNRQGKPVEGWFYLTVVTRAIPLQGGSGHVFLTELPLVCVLYAAPGQLVANEAMLTAILGTIQPDPEWLRAVTDYAAGQRQVMDTTNARLAQIHNEMEQDNFRTQQKIAAIHQDTAAYASRVYSNVARDRASVMDHSAQQFGLYMGDQAVYRNPQTGERVQMASGYDHAWASSTGNTDSYVLTDSASFDPNGKVGSGSWTQLQEEK